MKKLLSAFLFSFLFSLTAIAGEPSIWSVNSRAEVLKGDARGVSIDQNGTISLAPKLTEVFKTGQSYIWASAADTSGNVYLGTGGDGKVFKVDNNGKGALFSDLAEINVSAIAVGRAEIFAGTSPDGKVYRIDASGKAEVYFDPKEKYIWSMVILTDGTLAVGTGDGGKIYKVKSANATPESSLLFDTSETHIISLAGDKLGNLYAGSDSSGIVMKFGSDGKPFGLLDSSLREIHSIEIGPDGSIYVLALGESASAPKAPDAAAASAVVENKTVSVEKANPATPETPAKSRYDLTSAKSAVYRILADGATDILWTSTSVTGFSLFANENGTGVLLGTSDKGRIYEISNDGREKLLLQTDANQISTIRTNGKSLFATSSNQGSMFRIGSEFGGEGTYESAVLDAKTTATWGRIWWRSFGGVTIQTRSGNTEKADETWSGWSVGTSDPKGTQITSPKAKYLQWRAVLNPKVLPGGTSFASGPRFDGGVSLSEVSVAFIARNIAPEVLSIQVLPTNVGLAANPPMQIDPNIELSGLDPVTFGIPNAAIPPRRVYQRGATSLQWIAEDRNGDKLTYDVYFKQIGDADFKLLRGDLTDNFIAIDGQSLADGRYIFQIVANDLASNPVTLALKGDRTTEPVDIDNTAPVVTASEPGQRTGDKYRVFFNASDSSSYLTRAEYSVNGGEWKSVYADDGISDGPSERFTVEISVQNAGEYAVTLRVYDANGNAGNARLVVRK